MTDGGIMLCKDCAARREMARKALIEGKIAEAARQIIKGAAQMVGIRKKQ